ncbi:putative ATP-binding cassette transporter [Ekhidna lutea]|uniref:Putative ATP-binding cassette transporter n=1 Tax=Ekhidna lutea TaxID=447679 RepID=A0A239FSF9_EKHLU|nr:putative ATP-binding cassette transporter [Ekhidna lutea]
MKLLYYLLKTSKRNFVIASLSSVVTGLCSTLLIKTIHETLNNGIEDLIYFSLKVGILLIAYPAFAVLSSYKLARLTQTIIHNLRVQLSTKILNAEYSAVEKNKERLLPMLTHDISTISTAINRFPGIVTGLTTVIGLFIYMVWLSPILFGFTIVVFGLTFVIVSLMLPLLKKYTHQARMKWDEVFVELEAVVKGIKELSLNQKLKYKFLDDQLTDKSHQEKDLKVKESVVNSLLSRMTDVMLLFGIVILIFGIYTTQIVEFELLGEFLLISLFTVSPLSSATGFLGNIKAIEVALNNIEEMGLKLVGTKKHIQKLATKADEPGLIEVKGATYTYYNDTEDDQFLLGPINLKIKPNEVTFIVGGNGSGKTTLSKLLLGLYIPQDGHIEYNGEEITKDNRNGYRDQFKAIFDDSYLFDKLLVKSEDLPEDYAEKLIEAFRIDRKVSIKDGGFSTTKLSQGQTHRLRLISAIMENANIYLFDEWAANQDPSFKQIFYREIIPDLKKRGKTVIAITHDELFFDCADRVIKLRNGNLVEYAKAEK